jgi:hypothetical protein
MKKQTETRKKKPLALARETIRSLEQRQLGHVVGGMNSGDAPCASAGSCHAWCTGE